MSDARGAARVSSIVSCDMKSHIHYETQPAGSRNEEAVAARRVLESKMTAAQIADAQRRCLEFKPMKLAPFLW